MYRLLSMVLILMGTLLGGILGYHALSSQMVEMRGILRAKYEVDLTTESGGLVRTIECISGGDVKKGDVIVTLSAEPEIAKLSSLQATAELAQITYARDKEQFAIHAVSRAKLDEDLAELRSTQADVLEQDAIVAQKIVRAPFDGRLGISTVNLGQYLAKGDKIATLQALDPIYVDFYLPQTLFEQIGIHQIVYFRTNAYPHLEFEGKITGIDARFDPANQTVRVEAILSNSKYKLYPGISGTIHLKDDPKRGTTLAR